MDKKIYGKYYNIIFDIKENINLKWIQKNINTLEEKITKTMETYLYSNQSR